MTFMRLMESCPCEISPFNEPTFYSNPEEGPDTPIMALAFMRLQRIVRVESLLKTHTQQLHIPQQKKLCMPLTL